MNELITALTDAFGHSPFDVTDLLAARVKHPQLEAALDAAIPDCRYRSGYHRGQPNARRIRFALRKLPKQQLRAFHDARHDYWTFVVRYVSPDQKE